jgi:hypothetical protein
MWNKQRFMQKYALNGKICKNMRENGKNAKYAGN